MTDCTQSSDLSLSASAGGLTVDLNDRLRYFLRSYNGLGLPQISRLSQRWPNQSGDTDLGFVEAPRFVSLAWTFIGSDNPTYYGIREELESLFFARFNDPIQFDFVFSGGRPRSFLANLDGALDYPPADRGWYDQGFSAIFKASDPRVFDPTPRQVIYTILGATVPGIAIPWPVPTLVGSSTLAGEITILYAGGSRHAALEYPIITIEGPIDDPVVENRTTGEKIDLSANGGLQVAAGGRVTIDLAGGLRRDSKTIRDETGSSVTQFLSNDSDLATWHLAPAGELLPDSTYANGNNTIAVNGQQVTAATRVTIDYFDRYKGV